MRTLLTRSIAAIMMVMPASALAQEEDAPPPTMSVQTQPSDDEPSEEDMEAMFAALGSMFAVEPLTAEQEARLPLATTIIDKIMPEGTLPEMMGDSFNKMLGPLMELAGSSAAEQAISKGTGLSSFELELTEEEADEVATMFDPAYKERSEVAKALFPEMMNAVMAAMEPGMRKAMAELYAINFSKEELLGIDAFFSTDIGATYARKSFSMASDPRIALVSMEAMPAMMGTAMSMEEKQKKAEAGLPPVREFDQLSDEEKERIAYLTDKTVEELTAISAGIAAYTEADEEDQD